MKLTPIIEALVAGGSTPEQILRAVKAFEAQQTDALEQRRAADAKRQAAKRERAKSRDVTVRHSDRLLTGGDTRVEDKSLTQKIEPQVKTKNTDADFDAWWAVYPEKVGKGAARKAFPAARSKASLETLIDGVCRYIASKPGDRSYCHPSTWLNEERWDDQPAPMPQARAGPSRAPNIKDFFSAVGAANADRPKPHEPDVFYLPAATGH